MMMWCHKHGDVSVTIAGRCSICATEGALEGSLPPGALTWRIASPVGWTCPVCGGGVAPWLSRCPCVPEPKPKKKEGE
jgi:hypothetical protein